jgi:hypothetical protein
MLVKRMGDICDVIENRNQAAILCPAYLISIHAISQTDARIPRFHWTKNAQGHPTCLGRQRRRRHLIGCRFGLTSRVRRMRPHRLTRAEIHNPNRQKTRTRRCGFNVMTEAHHSTLVQSRQRSGLTGITVCNHPRSAHWGAHRGRSNAS